MNRAAAFRNALSTGRVILMDGAMGTELMRAGLRVPKESAARWNLTEPDRVRAVHERYVAAGASCLVTNTFDLAGLPFGPDEKRRIYEAGLDLARAVAGERWVLASFSAPIKVSSGKIDPTDPYGPSAFEVAQQVGQMAALGGADAILLETQTHLRFADQVVGELQRTCRSLPLIVSFAFARLDGGHWLGGLDKPELAARWAQAHRDCLLALGVNCGNQDLDEFVDIVKRCRRECDLPILARPSAGIPVQDGDRLLFPFTPAMMAARVPELIRAGVVLLGGCCGTTAEHIAAFRPIVEAWNQGLAN